MIEAEHLELLCEERRQVFMRRAGVLPVINRANLLVKSGVLHLQLLDVEEESLINIGVDAVMRQDYETVVFH